MTLLFWAIRYIVCSLLRPLYWSVMLMKYISSFLAHEAKLSDPQRVLADHFVKQGQEKNGEEEEPVVTIGCGYLDTPQKRLWEV